MDDSVVYVAHHTNVPVLAPAACQDWRRQLQLYDQQADPVRPMFLWASAIDEVQHFPPPPGQRCPEPGGLPPARAVPSGSSVSAAIGDLEGTAFPLLALSTSMPSLCKLAIVRLKRGMRTIEARNASAFWTSLMSAPGSWSSTFCRFMHTVLWMRSPPRTTHAASPPDLWIAWRHWHQGRREWREPSLRQCLPRSRGVIPARHAEDAPCGFGLARWRRDIPSCPAYVRAVDAPVCSVAAHAAGPHVAIAKGPASTASWFKLGGALAAAVLRCKLWARMTRTPMPIPGSRPRLLSTGWWQRMWRVSGAAMACNLDTDFARNAGGQAIADAWSKLRMDFEDAEALGRGCWLVAEGPPRVSADC